MEQNTDRMWWTIGIVVLGGVLIVGATALLKTNLLPNITAKINELFRQVHVPDVPVVQVPATK